MYDKAWAQDIVDNYHMMCARAHQIDMCIQQAYKERTGRECLIHDIRACLVRSLQGVIDRKLWIRYKRLVKRTPLDRDLLGMVCYTMIDKIDVDKLQRQFVWD